jgi:leucyl-tRNA---protein transferase
VRLVESRPVSTPLDLHAERTRRLAELLAAHGPRPGRAFPCPYLPAQEARQRLVLPSPLVPGLYHSLMDLNYRRLGPLFYEPACPSCDACRMIRVPVAAFRPSRAQRRCLLRNADVEVKAGEPLATAEKHDLYRRYLESRHDGQMDGSADEFLSFLYSSPIRSREMTYRVSGRLVSVGIVDEEPLAWSAVYCYFDPDLPKRSLGVLNVLRLIEACRAAGAAWLYLGYYVRESPRMSYKAGYRPCEVLGRDGVWRASD